MELIKQFDDVTNSEGVYSQICNACVNALAVEKNKLDFNAAIGICGVKGCNNDAEHYINLEK
ncbi:hypothetical protein NSQ62_08185 [Solibacillus sp. FSL H8-0523]|uniref:hypothetical protein n=1 Tax=Solibacillus sp. FSL H8-0523 TaxID=2954511 RepID=UPI003100CC6D